MPYRDRITKLREYHKQLNFQIDKIERGRLAEENGGTCGESLSEMKKKRLQFQDEIRRLEKLQYEENLKVEWGDE